MQLYILKDVCFANDKIVETAARFSPLTPNIGGYFFFSKK